MAAPAPVLARSTKRGVERLLVELQACWDVIVAATAALRSAAQCLPSNALAPGTLDQIRDEYEADAKALLLPPLQSYLEFRPIRRSLEALQEFDQDAGPAASRSRASLDSRFQVLLARASMQLCEPWRIRRGGGSASEWKDWETSQGLQANRAVALLAKYRAWAQAFEQGQPHVLADPGAHQRVERWWRQQRAVTALIEMELALYSIAEEWFRCVQDLVVSLQRERQEITATAHRVADWFERGAQSRSSTPVHDIKLATPDERLRAVRSELEEAAIKWLPESAEFVFPGRQMRWRSIKPRRAFLASFDRYCLPALQKAVFDYWDGTASLARETGRATEIVEYWRTRDSGKKSTDLFEEARRNAEIMLRERFEAPPPEERLEPSLVAAFLKWSREGSVAIEGAEFGWLALLRRPRGRHLVRAKISEGPQLAREGRDIATRWSLDQWNRVMEVLGGRLPPRPALEPVIRRATLRDTLALPAAKGAMPVIYQSLFRLAPIEDRRFLVGRDHELSGVEQALRDWDSGRFAACLVVGARGSGKTSLLNCACQGSFRDREVIRTQFDERALSEGAMDAFLRQRIGAALDTDLAVAFNEQRRILIIEEGERTFLRKVGGFRGAASLIQWIHRTAATTLWIIVMNDKAFRVLNSALQFGRIFSHRINAMHVSREHLENAIIERHRLSGLRLEFAAPPAGDPRIGRLKNLLGLQDSAQKLYFDSLFQQSGGVFRSAFELWLSSIERAEGNTMKIRQPLEPAFARFRAELTQNDHFTLLAIQEHGSLSEHEVGEVLCEPPETSRLRLDRLFALGLIEPDPEHPGLRVKPEASRFTNDALRRVNLV